MSDIEKRVENALDAYIEKFGKPFPLVIANAPTPDELLRQIEAAIKNNKPVPEPKYKPGALY